MWRLMPHCELKRQIFKMCLPSSSHARLSSREICYNGAWTNPVCTAQASWCQPVQKARTDAVRVARNASLALHLNASWPSCVLSAQSPCATTVHKNGNNNGNKKPKRTGQVGEHCDNYKGLVAPELKPSGPGAFCGQGDADDLEHITGLHPTSRRASPTSASIRDSL
eukprot:CAMPEP_0177312476 /NCGR_PEP_ID=MMETSP0368-20130122/10907_1 /TAXON_ID=447022 ORGANISM="Scrippsiella hangoei-like, Strain SHHI-4" /NCGR_SAMPLE_ID=MMETSP0368 /ASSEMBLY_ACC=CAM_ASM_000363 /LENGTH=166 /DNA_ID=CAMNT_0018771533 /DNA_START=35 /DNA_END=532 /DNA_ORIENTATION=+